MVSFVHICFIIPFVLNKIHLIQMSIGENRSEAYLSKFQR